VYHAAGAEYFPFLATGFEYGMLGVSLFGAAYGLEAVGTIAVVDLGHEIFIWFVFLALLLKKRDDLQGAGQLAKVFFQSPVVIAILLGILFNLLGLQVFLTEGIVTGAVIAALNFLSNLTVPLILIIVGYGIKLSAEGLRESLLVTLLRLGLLVPLALVVNALLIRGALGLGKPFEAALFTLFVLPPPFIIPLYMRSGDEDERRYVNNVLALHTVVSLILFTTYLILNPVI
jgi:predicted permease